VTFDLDENELDSQLRASRGPVVSDLRRRVDQVYEAALREAPVRTGELRESHYGVVVNDGGELYGEVGAKAPYSAFVHEGTGLFGPLRRPIEAKPGRVFVFTGSNGETVFTTRIKGQHPNRWLVRALDAMTD